MGRCSCRYWVNIVDATQVTALRDAIGMDGWRFVTLETNILNAASEPRELCVPAGRAEAK